MNHAEEFYRLSEKYGTDKAKWHRYDIPYGSLFGPLRDKPVRILEIGVFRGASLRLWEEWFPLATIFGVDDCSETKKRYVASAESNRSRVFFGKQDDPAFLERLVAETGGKFDIIIDDGGHRAHEQQISFEVLYPHVTHGGYYVIEDLETAYGKFLFQPTKTPDISRWNTDGRITTPQWIYQKLDDVFGRLEGVTDAFHCYRNMVVVEKMSQ
jgi:hypothetical protein